MRPILISFGPVHFLSHRLGPFHIYSYGFMLMLGFAVGIAWGCREARRRGLSPDLVLDYGLWALLSAIGGARAVFVLLNLPDYAQAPLTIVTGRGGLSFHGGLAGALLALYFFCRKRGVRFTEMTDLLAPALPLGFAFARIGCFLNGCCYGVPTHLPWACQFVNSDLPGGHTPPSHPVQLYSSVLNLGLFALLAWAGRRPRFRGELTLWYLGLYSILRFGLEFLRRGVTGKIFVLGLTEAQVASLVIIAFTLVCFQVGRGRARAARRTKHKGPRG